MDLESILNQTFNDEYTRLANKPISTSETKNVDDIFANIDNITECIICSNDDRICIKCFQCTAYYCKECLTKIASDFNKCSSCSIKIKENYTKFKDHNQELQEQLQIEKAIANSLNEYTNKKANSSNNKTGSQKSSMKTNSNNNNNNNNQNSNSNINNDNNNDYIYNSESDELDEEEDEDEEDEEEDTNNNKNNNNINNNNNKNNNSKNSKNKINSKNVKNNLKPSLMNLFKFKTENKNSKNNENNENTENNKNTNNTENIFNTNIFDKKKIFIESLREDKIYNINFTSYINEISPNRPNYSYEWNHTNQTLTFYALCNQNKDFSNIVLNYNILKSTFQAILYIWLNEIINSSFSTFKIKWNKIATKINAMSIRNDEISNAEIKKFTREIVNICKN